VSEPERERQRAEERHDDVGTWTSEPSVEGQVKWVINRGSSVGTGQGGYYCPVRGQDAHDKKSRGPFGRGERDSRGKRVDGEWPRRRGRVE
jgi:hypothetical protein